MRVDLAAQVLLYITCTLFCASCEVSFFVRTIYIIYTYLLQVLSQTVSKALELTGGDEAKETAKFVDLFDKFFDCLNVNSFTKGKHSRKVFQNPYRKATDFRLKVCICIIL